jgi:hypothetical protein
MESERNPAIFAFFESTLLIVDVVHPTAIPRLVEFFVIRHFTRIHKGKKLAVEVHGTGETREATRASKKKWCQRNSIGRVKVNENWAPLKYDCIEEIVGRDMVCQLEMAAHLRVGKLEVLPRCPHVRWSAYSPIKPLNGHTCRTW